jgi:hypothetical protein
MRATGDWRLATGTGMDMNDILMKEFRGEGEIIYKSAFDSMHTQ